MHDNRPARETAGAAMPVKVTGSPTPFALAIAAQLTARHRDGRMATLEGTVLIASPADPRAVTLRLGGGCVTIAEGAQADADLRAVVVDGEHHPVHHVENPDDNPELAAWLLEALAAPRTDWRSAAEAFWTRNAAVKAMPRNLSVTETGRGETLLVGDDGPAEYEIHAPADVLVAVFTGRLPLVDAAVLGKARVRGTLAHLSVLTGGCYSIAMGDEW